MDVLIVDDNANDRKLLRCTLEHQGCRVAEAHDGQEGLEKAKALKPDLIISDALMPRMDGFEFLRRVKMELNLQFVPFLFHTAVYTGVKEKELALSLGAEAFLAKPMEPAAIWEELTAVIQRRLAGKKSPVAVSLMEEEQDFLKRYSNVVASKLEEKVKELEQTLVERQRGEEALRASEQQRYRLETELAYAAEIQAKLMPDSHPNLPGFDFAARCLPAQQVGGDFYDWIEVAPGNIAFTLGDVMGKGMSAATLMMIVMAAIHAATLQNGPAEAVQLAERAIRSNLERFESFVTLFHARLDARARVLTYVDCGHSFAFLRRSDGSVEELNPRGLPMGVASKARYQEGAVTFGQGDALVLYSDGLIDVRPELELTHEVLAGLLDKAACAKDILAVLLELPTHQVPPSDDQTVLVIRSAEAKGAEIGMKAPGAEG